MSEIPKKVRDLVRQREHHRCCRCGVPAPNGHAHHRRSRSVRDRHQHCPCSLVWVCAVCHAWAHTHPAAARDGGWIVSKFVTEPGTVAVSTPWGERMHDCEGGVTYAE